MPKRTLKDVEIKEFKILKIHVWRLDELPTSFYITILKEDWSKEDFEDNVIYYVDRLAKYLQKRKLINDNESLDFEDFIDHLDFVALGGTVFNKKPIGVF